MKRMCRKCGEEKDINLFYKSKKNRSGYETVCMECRYKARLTVCIRCDTCKIFYKNTKQHAQNGSKYCSRFCMAMAMRGRKQPKHVMDIMKKTWIKKGQRLSPETEFKKGSGGRKKHPFLKYKTKEKHLVEYKCSFCGVIFEDYSYRGRGKKNIYCSIDCMGNHYSRGGAKAARDELRDAYIKTCIQNNTKIRSKDITPEMIELKRMQVKFHREIKKGKEQLNEIYQNV